MKICETLYCQKLDGHGGPHGEWDAGRKEWIPVRTLARPLHPAVECSGYVIEAHSCTDRHGHVLPRYVGPFDHRKLAEDWAQVTIRNGSYSVVPTFAPRAVSSGVSDQEGDTNG